MGYLVIAAGGTSSGCRVDLARFAELFAEDETPPPVRPRRALPRIGALRMPAAALTAILAANLATLTRPTAHAPAPHPAYAATSSCGGC